MINKNYFFPSDSRCHVQPLQRSLSLFMHLTPPYPFRSVPNNKFSLSYNASINSLPIYYHFFTPLKYISLRITPFSFSPSTTITKPIQFIRTFYNRTALSKGTSLFFPLISLVRLTPTSNNCHAAICHGLGKKFSSLDASSSVARAPNRKEACNICTSLHNDTEQENPKGDG